MTPDHVVQAICSSFPDLIVRSSWGETALFYNPKRALPNGVYFCTIKQHDGENDKASKLDREGVFRLAIGLSPPSYLKLFGRPPGRPNKGGVVATGHDFTLSNELMPHPIYAWMSWAQILNPTLEAMQALHPLIAESHSMAATKFVKRMVKKPASTIMDRSKGSQI
jgi:Family of unknown function (DUF6194)